MVSGRLVPGARTGAHRLPPSFGIMHIPANYGASENIGQKWLFLRVSLLNVSPHPGRVAAIVSDSTMHKHQEKLL